jgi:hypothetical protein
LSSGTKRREHYVPQFYLKLFGDRLFVFDKSTGKDFQTGSKNIALEQGFYDLDQEIDLEGAVAEIEGRLRIGISELIDKLHPDKISKDARIRIAVFVALQYVRTKDFREWIKEFGEKLATAYIRSDPRFKNEEFTITMKPELARALQAEWMVDDTIPKLGYRLGHSLWSLLLNKTKIPFWTSDNPVALFNPIDYGDKSGVGFAVKGIQIHFPLNSNLLLLILDPTTYQTPPVRDVYDEDSVIHENELQLYNATRFVVSSAGDFSVANRLRQEDETLGKKPVRVILRKINVGGRSFIQMSNTMKTQSGPNEKISE